MSYKEKRQTASKRDCKCDDCGTTIREGAQCIVDPKKKKVYCLKHGKNKDS